ncbi:hypothetical protein MUO65_06655, partial [bacterium]|nr:hypothetical protein [bacterium]
MKKILTLSIALVLVAGIVSLAKSADIDNTLDYNKATGDSKDRHVVKSSNGTLVVVYTNRVWVGDVGIRAKKSTDFGATWTNLQGGPGYTLVEFTYTDQFSVCIAGNDNIYVAYSAWSTIWL